MSVSVCRALIGGMSLCEGLGSDLLMYKFLRKTASDVQRKIYIYLLRLLFLFIQRTLNFLLDNTMYGPYRRYVDFGSAILTLLISVGALANSKLLTRFSQQNDLAVSSPAWTENIRTVLCISLFILKIKAHTLPAQYNSDNTLNKLE